MDRAAYQFGSFFVTTFAVVGGFLLAISSEFIPVFLSIALVVLSYKFASDVVNDAYNEENFYSRMKRDEIKEERDTYKWILEQVSGEIPARFEVVNDGEIAIRPVNDITNDSKNTTGESN